MKKIPSKAPVICVGVIVLCALVHIITAAWNYPHVFTAVPLWMILCGIAAFWGIVLLVCLGIILLVARKTNSGN